MLRESGWRVGLWIGAVLAILGTPALAPTAAAQGLSQNLVIQNEFIAIMVNARAKNAGRFSVYTTGGDPVRKDDDGKPLIYGVPDPGPWTSYTTVQVDGQNYVFGGPTDDRPGRAGRYGTAIQAPTRVGNEQIVATWRVGPVEATQTVGFVKSLTTGLPDTARIAYTLRNPDARSHEVGLRMALDTMLGENDGAPFRVGNRAITTDTFFSGEAIPDFWQAFDSLGAPQVTAQGTLRGGEVTTPDRAYFTNWGALADGAWDFSFQPGRDFTRLGEFELDSALALLWSARPLAPGESRTYVAHYGLGGITIVPGRLAVGVTAPAEVVAGRDVTFPVVAYVQNTGEGTARGVKARVVLPPGFSLTSGAAAQEVSDVPVNGTAQVSWRVRVPQTARGEFRFTVRVEAINSDPNQVERQIAVVSPARLALELVAPQGRLAVKEDRWQPLPFPVQVRVRNEGGTTAYGVELAWAAPFGLQLAEGDRATKPIGALDPGKQISLSWHITPTGSTGNLPYTVQVKSTVEESLRAVASGFLDVPALEAKVGLRILSREGKPIDTVPEGESCFIQIVAVNVRSLYAASVDLVYDPKVIAVLTDSSLGVDRGTVFVAGTPGEPGATYLSWDEPQIAAAGGGLNRVHISGSRSPAEPLELANGTLATIRCVALKAGASPLILRNLTLKGKANQPVGAIKQDSAVQVVRGTN